MHGLPWRLAAVLVAGFLAGSIARPAYATEEPSENPAGEVELNDSITRPNSATTDSATTDSATTDSATADPAATIIASLTPERRELAHDVLERNPELARAARLAATSAARAPQLRAWPDPVAALDVFVLPPETRAGPQRLRLSIQQKVPTFGKLELAERAAILDAAAAELDVREMRLELVAETRRLADELAFLATREQILGSERLSLERFESAAQARYAAGTGLQQESVRIQAQITRVDTELLELEERRASLLAALNRLRDRPPATALPAPTPSKAAIADLQASRLGEKAKEQRPAVAADQARIEAARLRARLAERKFRPDLTVGLGFTAVDRRQDLAGRRNPPEDNGDDIFSLRAAVNLPVHRRALEAAVSEAQARTWAAEEHERATLAEIESRVGDLVSRLPLLRRHLELLENVLLKQAREALRSAESAYSTGKLNAVDLLDAEVMLFDVRIAAARTRADLAIARSRLERQIAAPLRPHAAESPQEKASEEIEP